MLSSPRRRRRLARLGAAGLVVGAIAAVVVLVPDHTVPSPPAPKSAAPPSNTASSQSTRKTPSTHRSGRHTARHHGITPADRRAINATLDEFIPDALGQHSMATAWRLAGPELKSASTLKQWRHDTSPIPYFPVAGKKFHGWKTIDASRNAVEFDILVEPRPHTRYGSWVFSGEVIRRHSHWLVNRLYTTAEMQPVRGSRHEIGTADFSAPAAAGAPTTSKARLSGVWLLAIAGVIGLALLFPIAFGIVSVVRNRQRRTGTDRALPPLPQKR
jgi:hypothetical protein